MTPNIRSSSCFSKPFITDVTVIKLAIPIVRPIIANKVVKEKMPPLRDFKYLYPRSNDIDNTIYFSNFVKTFSIFFLYGGLTASKSLSSLKEISLKYALELEKFLKPSKD